MTDLYVQKPTHTDEEERHFTELALRLIDAVDVAREQPWPRRSRLCSAPPAVLRRLARDVIEVAEPVLRHSPCLDNAELRAVVDEMRASHAKLIAARSRAGSGRSAGATAGSPCRTPQPQAIAAARSRDELSELFFAANAAESAG